MEHRNSQKRFYDDEYVYFVTSKTHQNFPFFEEEIFCNLWIEELKVCKALKKFELYGFCLNYDHFHSMLKAGKEANISQVMQFLKRHFSRNANIIMNPDFHTDPEGDIRECRLQEGRYKNLNSIVSNHDQKIINFQKQFLQKYLNPSLHFPPFKWQKSFHDHVIRNEYDFKIRLKYTIYNFQKHGFSDDWKYTSLNFPELIDES